MKKYLLMMILATVLSIATVSMVSAQGGENIHYVQYGESLYGIADQYGVSAQTIMRYNGIINADLIYVGQPLVIPGSYNSAPYYGAPASSSNCANYHIVTAGQTLSDIAYDYGLTLYALLDQNNLYNKDLVYVGQKICLPASAGYQPQPASYSSPANAYYHTVTDGETVYIIAGRYGVSHLDVMRANNLNNAGFIMAGQRLVIPGYQAPVKPVPSAYYNSPKPVYEQSYSAPGYAPSPVVQVTPSPAPVYDGTSGSSSTSIEAIPSAPEYQTSPARPILPEADHPIEVVVNGGVHWVGEIHSIPDPTSITTLIVRTGDKLGLPVKVRSGDYEVVGESTDANTGEFGQFTFVFRYIPPGDYDVWIDDPNQPSEVVQISVEPGDRVYVNFGDGLGFSGPNFASPGGWILSSWDNPSKPHQNIGSWSNILVHTPASGLNIKIESEGGGYQATCFTGSKGPGSCDFAGLSAGLYWIWIDGTDLKVKTYMDGAAYATFELSRQPSASTESVIGPVSYGSG